MVLVPAVVEQEVAEEDIIPPDEGGESEEDHESDAPTQASTGTSIEDRIDGVCEQAPPPLGTNSPECAPMLVLQQLHILL